MSGIGRRALLQGGGAMAVPGLGRPAPSRFPYPRRPESSPGVGPAAGNIVRARQVIVAGPNGGMFVYSGRPQLGSMIGTIGIGQANAGSADKYGNHYLQGDTDYLGGIPGSSHATLATQLFGGAVTWNSWNGSSWLPVAQLSANAPSGNVTIGSLGSGTLTLKGPVTATGGTPANPSVISTDTWNPMTLLNSWASGGRAAPRYKLVAAPDKAMWLFGSLTAPAGIAAGQAIWDLPAGYTVNSAQSVVCRNQSTNGVVMLSIFLGSPQMLQYQSGAVAGNVIDFNYLASLDG